MRFAALAASSALLLLAMQLPTASADARSDTVCFIHSLGDGVSARRQVACYDGLVASCLVRTMEGQTLDSSLRDGNRHDEACFSYLTGLEPPCQGINCQLACIAYGCVGTFYGYEGMGLGASRVVGVYVLDGYTAVYAGPDGVYLLYGGGISHCRSGVSTYGDVVLHDCVF